MQLKSGLNLLFAVFAVSVASKPSVAEQPVKPAAAVANVPETPTTRALAKAEKLFKEGNWSEAREVYDAARDLEKDWRSAPVRLAVEGGVAASLKLKLWDDALNRAQQFVDKTKGSFEEAVGERFLAGLYVSVPHYGTKRGTIYLRGQYTQGVRVSSWRRDRREAITHYERARERLITLGNANENAEDEDQSKLINAERIGVDFDLSGVLSQQTGYGGRYGYGRWGWLGWWWRRGLEPEEDSEALEVADYEESRWWGEGQNNQEIPTGIPLGADGRPQFIEVPPRYSSEIGDGPKIRFLLDEIQKLDTSANKDDAAKALFRWAMIARSLYGPEAIAQWQSLNVRTDRRGRPLPSVADADSPVKNVWELKDDESATIVGGRLRTVELPAGESPVALLRLIEEKYPRSTASAEAHYARALYFQTRQQFPQAIAEYRSLIQQYPAHKRVNSARSQIALIEQPQVMPGNSGVYLPAGKPRLSFTYNNTDKVTFKAIRVDLAKYVQDCMQDSKTNGWWEYRNIDYNFFNEDKYKAYLGDQVVAWSESVRRESGNRVAEGSTLAPLSEPGAYVVESGIIGQTEIKRVLVLVTDVAIVHKNLVKKGLIWLADARSGQPLAGKTVRVYEHWSEYKESKNTLHWDSTMQTTNKDGAIEYTRKHEGSQVDAVVLGDNRRMAFSFFQSWSEYDSGEWQDSGSRYYAITDRPVYRPNSTVKFRVWLRRKNQGQFEPPTPAQNVSLAVYDAKNVEVKTFQLQSDELGGVSGQFELGDEPPLGIYHLQVNGQSPDAHGMAGGLFRVEEYKKPEFEVNVKPSKTQARLGEKVQARIEARYYFGAPVAGAQVTYKVFRENYDQVYMGEGEYDWLYGQGYGRYQYAYPWLPWWGRWGRYMVWDDWYFSPYQSAYYPWGYYGESSYRSRIESGTRKALRELVSQGTALLKADGTYEVEIDTSRDKNKGGDQDSRYTVEAEVRDASRRTIEGKGNLIVTRQQFSAFVETDGGWYGPKNEAQVRVRTLTPDNLPVATRGEVVVSRITNGGGALREEVVRRWAAATDVEGRLSFKYPIPGEGQYRVAFKTHDSWNEEVVGNAIFWVNGPKFEGRVYRFNDLEVIADKRTYKVGDTAHLLINTAETNSRVLFSDEVGQGTLRSYRFIDIAGRSTVIDIPITPRQVPNFFVEATLVQNGRVHTESQELFVPPVQGLLNVSLKTDKPSYKSGEKGRVQVAVTDAAGKPVRGQVALTAYDQSVTYIQDEFGPSPRVFYYGQKRRHDPYVDASMDRTFAAYGGFMRAERYAYEGSEVDGWRGYWGLADSGLTLSGSLTKAKSSFESRMDDRIISLESGVRTHFAIGSEFGGGFGGGVAGLPVSARTLAIGSLRGGVANGLVYDNDLGVGQQALVEPEIRTNFADTALWLPNLTLDKNGKAETEIDFPDSLTTWRVRGYTLTGSTQVGDATATATTSKNLLIRLQSPRFFVERDEVVLSANVHNYLKTSKKVRAELIIDAKLFSNAGVVEASLAPPDKDGNLHLWAEADVAAGGEHRFDWPVKVLEAGFARITVKALTDEESDGMRLAFPVLVHGTDKTVTHSGSYRVAQDGTRTMKLDLPQQINPDHTRLEVTLSPSLAGVMVDTLPYLTGYPYGCVEQTMSRFYPSILVKDTLKKMGTDLETIGKQRRQMNEGDLKNRFAGSESPVFDSAELDRMVRAGLDRIYNFQRSDGGWGWWSEDDSSPYQTAYVLQGLKAAIDAGVNVDRGVYSRGIYYLRNSIQRQMLKAADQRDTGDLQTQAYIAYILSFEGALQNDEERAWLDELYTGREKLNNYGRSLLALAMFNFKKTDEAKMLLRNVLQFVERDDTNETAWVRTPTTYWWYWWNNDIETNAWALKALATIEPKSDLAPRLVKWLLNNRHNGSYWRSTRDTAQVVSAMSAYMKASGEAAPDYTLTVNLNGQAVKEVKINKDNFFSFDNRIVLTGEQVKPGPHQITLSKKGTGALYYSTYLSYFTKEEDVKGAGNEVLVEREYFKLVPRTETVVLPDAGQVQTLPAGQALSLSATGRTELRDGFTRVPLKTGDAVKSGEQIEVVLKINAKNTYDYLAFEDMKPAGCEPVELRSGGRWAGGLCANVELRDEKVVFFIGLLEQGQHVLRYKLRAETPGQFHALPTKGFAMYAPEVKSISDEMRLQIKE